MKKLIAVAAAVALAVPLAACGSSSTTAADDGTPIQFYLSGDANQGGGYAKMAAKYQTETGVKVEIVDIANADIATKVKNAAQAGDLPALARMPAIDPVWKDQLVDLKDIATANKVKMSMAAVDSSGKVLSIPSDVTAVGMFINKTLWDKAGVKYPTSASDIWTWDQYVASAKEVQAKTGAKYGMVMDRSSHRLRSFLYEFGSNGWAPDSSGTYVTNDATKTALEYFKGLNDDKFMPRSVWLSKDDPNALFKSGQVAAYYSGSWQIADFATNVKDFQWLSVYAPKQPTRAVNYGNAASMVVFDTPQKAKALAFLNWLYKSDNYAQLCQYSSMLPAVDGATVTYTANNDSFKLYNEEISASDPIVGTQKSLGIASEVAGKATDGDPIRDETIKYVNNEETVDQALANISKLLTTALK